MKLLVTAFSFAFAGVGFAQDELVSPLLTNPHAPAKPLQQRSGGTIDSMFIYNVDTLDLPIFDDFSVDKFMHYDAGYTDGNVTSQWYYRLMNSSNTVKQNPSLIFCDSTHAHHDTVSVVAGIATVTTDYFTTPNSVWVNNLTTYPVQGQLRTLYQECYVLIDSIIDGAPDPDQDTVWYTASPDFVQDSAQVFFVDYSDNSTLWVDSLAYRNYRYAVAPRSLGVATFDGVDQYGWPYDWGNTSAHEKADVLTSRPINLAGTSGVYLTFIYQAEGYGNAPEANDSLILEWWLPDSSAWYPSQWFALGGGATDVWDTVHWAVPTAALDNGFRFRFSNWASTSGNLDHWHIDYVSLDSLQTGVVETFNDLAISEPLNTLLDSYTAVPWDHYRASASVLRMQGPTNLKVFNSSPSEILFDPVNGFLKVEHQGTTEFSHTWPNIGNWSVGFTFYPYTPQSLGYFYNPLITTNPQAVFDVTAVIAENTSINNSHPENDTTRFQQKFDNYYSYDDGSAEAAYGITGSHALMAYKFTAYEADTLTGVLMHWVPSVDDHTDKIFLLTVWDDNAGQPGSIIYQDDYFNTHSPEYSGGLNAFRYYTFMNDQHLAVPQTFYIGWEQIDAVSLNIGLDWNIDNSDKIFRNTSGTWNTSSYDASLLIRPVFSTALNYSLGERETLADEPVQVAVYPNPAKDLVNIQINQAQFGVTLYDMTGRQVLSTSNEFQLDLSNLNAGIYLIDIRDTNGVSLYSGKLIKE